MEMVISCTSFSTVRHFADRFQSFSKFPEMRICPTDVSTSAGDCGAPSADPAISGGTAS